MGCTVSKPDLAFYGKIHTVTFPLFTLEWKRTTDAIAAGWFQNAVCACAINKALFLVFGLKDVAVPSCIVSGNDFQFYMSRAIEVDAGSSKSKLVYEVAAVSPTLSIQNTDHIPQIRAWFSSIRSWILKTTLQFAKIMEQQRIEEALKKIQSLPHVQRAQQAPPNNDPNQAVTNIMSSFSQLSVTAQKKAAGQIAEKINQYQRSADQN